MTKHIWLNKHVNYEHALSNLGEIGYFLCDMRPCSKNTH
jgi:hypothetical protein